MGQNYYFVCHDCGMMVSVGQLYWETPEGKPLDDVTFFGVYYRLDGMVHKRDEVFGRAIEKFLIVHRNHHLMFVPEGAVEALEGEMPEGPIVDADDLMAIPVDPLPNPAEEAKQWIRKLGKEADPRFCSQFRTER